MWAVYSSPVSGRVLDWVIDGLKTTSAESGSELDEEWDDEDMPTDGVRSLFRILGRSSSCSSCSHSRLSNGSGTVALILQGSKSTTYEPLCYLLDRSDSRTRGGKIISNIYLQKYCLWSIIHTKNYTRIEKTLQWEQGILHHLRV